jgi:cellulose 1,4-beta-cellobiosidase
VEGLLSSKKHQIVRMKFAALASLVACIPVVVKAAGSGNPFDGATIFQIPEYADEVNSAAGK